MVTPHNQPQTQHVSGTLPKGEPVLSPSQLLKSAALERWLRDGHNYLDRLALKILDVYSVEPEWIEVVEDNRTTYQPLVEKAAGLGAQILSSIETVEKELILSPRQKSVLYDELVQPILLDLCELLGECESVIPELNRKSARLVLTKGETGHRFQGSELETLVARAELATREEIEDLSRCMRALALVQLPSAQSFDLTRAALHFMSSAANSSFRSLGWPPSSVIVACPADLAEITLGTLASEINNIALDLRDMMRRKVRDVTILDALAVKDEDSEQGRLVNLILLGELMVSEVQPDGALVISVPVAKDDFESLALLRDKITTLIGQYNAPLHLLGVEISTGSRDHATNDSLAEFSVKLQFTALEPQPENAVTLTDYSSTTAKGQNLLAKIQTASLIRSMPNGREYFTVASAPLLTEDRVIEDYGILEEIDRIVESCRCVDTVWFDQQEVKALAKKGTNREVSDDDDNLDALDPDPQPEKEVTVRFLGAKWGQYGVRERSKKSAVYSLRQMEAVASKGRKVAGVIIDPKPDMPPPVNVLVRESFLKNRELVDALERLLGKCNIGFFELNKSDAEARDLLAAIYSALDEYVAATGATERVTLQLQERPVGATFSGILSFRNAPVIQIHDAQGRVLAEGEYVPMTKEFNLRYVPDSVLTALCNTLAASLRDVVERDGVLRIAPLSVAVEARGYRLADRVLWNVLERFKALEGRAYPEDLPQQLESYLRGLFLKIKLRSPKFDEISGRCDILTDEDLPPAQRR